MGWYGAKMLETQEAKVKVNQGQITLHGLASKVVNNVYFDAGGRKGPITNVSSDIVGSYFIPGIIGEIHYSIGVDPKDAKEKVVQLVDLSELYRNPEKLQQLIEMHREKDNLKTGYSSGFKMLSSIGDIPWNMSKYPKEKDLAKESIELIKIHDLEAKVKSAKELLEHIGIESVATNINYLAEENLKSFEAGFLK